MLKIFGGDIKISKELRVNEQIKAKEIRLIGSDGAQIGIVPVAEGLRVAQENNLDLVEVSPNAKPPVCKIMDYGKYRYEQNKREREARKNQKVINVKEVKFRVGIEEHDYQVKARNAIKFLKNGDKVKVTVMFRGREIAHSELGKEICDRLAKDLDDIAKVEKKPKVEGRNMTMVLVPKQ